LHEPDLIILDEPFSGFDPVNAEIIKDEILELNRKGATILFSTHRMESVEELCDAIALLNLSQKILDGKIRDIKNTYRNDVYIIDYSGEKLTLNGTPPFELLEDITDRYGDHTIKIKLKADSTSNEVLQYLIPQTHITRLQEVIPSMNEIFIEQVSKIA
jgi:ABC-2 type transport system ATP-binding protein